MINSPTWVGDYSNDEGPIDFEKSYIWELHKSCGVSQAEKDALAHICESDFDGEISSLFSGFHQLYSWPIAHWIHIQ